MDDYIPRLKKCIKTGKTGQAKTIIEQLAQRHDSEKEETLQILALAPDKIAFELLDFLSRKENQDPQIYSRLTQLIIDRSHLNYTFIQILLDHAEKPTISSAVPLIRHILSNETEKTVLNKIIRAAGKLQINALTDDIAEFIFYDDALLKRETVKALERIGTPHSCQKLEQASRTEKCDQDILDAIEVLKTQTQEESTQKIEELKEEEQVPLKSVESLTAESHQERFQAIKHFSGDSLSASKLLSSHLDTENDDLTLNLLQITARAIPHNAVNDLFSIINNKKTDNAIKFAAYNALASFPELESAASIIQGVSEPAMFVRMAAIKALDKNLSDLVCAEIKTKIESGTKTGETLAQTILDARAKNLIEYLMISDTFSYIASNYLARSAPEAVLDTFINILENRKLRSTAKKYKDLKEEKTAQNREEFIVISLSESVLNVYSKLIYSCGFSSLTFLRAQDAFETIVANAPRAIICDLFLNNMTGLDLAREVRGLYPEDKVPVIISSLQKTLEPKKLKQEMDLSGATTFCTFPPKTTQIKSWVK